MSRHNKGKKLVRVLAPIKESRLRVRFAFEEVIKFDAVDLGAKKVTASRTQDHFAYSNEQLVYRLALTARNHMAREDLNDSSGICARARAELLHSTLMTDDETHLGLNLLDVVEHETFMPQTYASLDEEANSIAATADDFSDSDDDDVAPSFWSSSSTNLGSVLDRLRSFRNSFGKSCTSVANVDSLRFRWTRKHRRVTPEFDAIILA
eukprot:TRINITY_DN6630_c0_g1_i1.p1 TRINITY_DN6630_c0_g1~~TRINITY_DN6630_c0_g1_i1.p1  ORF type:complete len:208 (-),score=29.58 TRINITY_DN6630_c0_g1_i1:274-897(-)